MVVCTIPLSFTHSFIWFTGSAFICLFCRVFFFLFFHITVLMLLSFGIGSVFWGRDVFSAPGVACRQGSDTGMTQWATIGFMHENDMRTIHDTGMDGTLRLHVPTLHNGVIRRCYQGTNSWTRLMSPHST